MNIAQCRLTRRQHGRLTFLATVSYRYKRLTVPSAKDKYKFVLEGYKMYYSFSFLFRGSILVYFKSSQEGREGGRTTSQEKKSIVFASLQTDVVRNSN